MRIARLSRRELLKAAVAASALAIPAALGLEFARASEQVVPALQSPYARSENDASTLSYPLLLLTTAPTASNPFCGYLAEILRAEGFNVFANAPLDPFGATALEAFDTVILAEQVLNPAQATRLENFVRQGGRLIGMRPDASLATVFGVIRGRGRTADARLRVNSRHPLAPGIETTPLQFHGEADHYALRGAELVAALENGVPAITIHRYGDGYAMLWAYDLAQSIVLTRQGNPARINQAYAGQNGVRALGLFGDGWLDLERMGIAQADEQQRLLANALVFFSRARRPLPRLWYFPGNANGVLIPTSDTHVKPAAAIEQVLTRVERFGGHASIYYTAPLWGNVVVRAGRGVRNILTDTVPGIGALIGYRTDVPSEAHVAAWRTRGHEFGLHPYVDTGLQSGWQDCVESFLQHGYAPLGRTVRTHRALWQGWTDTAELQAGYGIRMNFDYYHWGLPLRAKNGEWLSGYLTGSGLPMKFVDAEGRVLEIYQQLTALVDEHLLDLGWADPHQSTLSVEDALSFADSLLARLKRTPTALAAQFHSDPFAAENSESMTRAAKFLEGVLERAARAHLPILSAEMWLAFTEARATARFEEMTWNEPAGRLEFRLAGVEAQTLLLPLEHDGRGLSGITLNGSDTMFQARRVGGVDYAAVNIVNPAQGVSAVYAG